MATECWDSDQKLRGPFFPEIDENRQSRQLCSFDKVLAQKVSKRNRHAAAAAEQEKHACLDKISTTAVPSDLITRSSDSDHHRAEDSDNDDSEVLCGQPVDTTLVYLCYPIYSVT